MGYGIPRREMSEGGGDSMRGKDKLILRIEEEEYIYEEWELDNE